MIQKLIIRREYFKIVFKSFSNVGVIKVDLNSFIALFFDSQHEGLPFFDLVDCWVDYYSFGKNYFIVEVAQFFVVEHFSYLEFEL